MAHKSYPAQSATYSPPFLSALYQYELVPGGKWIGEFMTPSAGHHFQMPPLCKDSEHHEERKQ